MGLDNDKVDYAVGAPNGNAAGFFSGIVYLCPNCFRENPEATLSIPENYELILQGFQYGEKFGIHSTQATFMVYQITIRINKSQFLLCQILTMFRACI